MGSTAPTSTVYLTSFTTQTQTVTANPPDQTGFPNTFQCFGAQVYATSHPGLADNNADVCIVAAVAGAIAVLAGIAVVVLAGTINRRDSDDADSSFDPSSPFRRQHDQIEFQNPLEQDPANRPRTFGERLANIFGMHWKAGLTKFAPAAQRAFQLYSLSRQGEELGYPVERSRRSPDDDGANDDDGNAENLLVELEEEKAEENLHDIFHFHPDKKKPCIVTVVVTSTRFHTVTRPSEMSTMMTMTIA